MKPLREHFNRAAAVPTQAHALRVRVGRGQARVSRACAQQPPTKGRLERPPWTPWRLRRPSVLEVAAHVVERLFVRRTSEDHELVAHVRQRATDPWGGPAAFCAVRAPVPRAPRRRRHDARIRLAHGAAAGRVASPRKQRAPQPDHPSVYTRGSGTESVACSPTVLRTQ